MAAVAPWAMMGLSAASTAYGVFANNKAQDATIEAAQAQQRMQNAQTMNQYNDVNENTGLSLTERAREALRQQAQARVAQAESGVAGISPIRDLANIYMQQGIDNGSIMAKGESQLYQTSMGAKAKELEAQSTMNRARANKTGMLGAGLQIGASGAAGYFTGANATKVL